MKTLVVFDFDHTVVDDNSDTWVLRCLPGEELPDSLKNSYKKGHWTEFMGRVMKYIGDQEVTPAQVRSVMESIPFTPGIKDVLTFILERKSNIDCIIISDSNTMFIDWILRAAGFQAAVDQVFSNSAKFNNLGYMEVQCHHSHDCESCPINLCKKRVLELFLSGQLNDGVKYKQVFYVGDGGNDLCPTSCLGGGDIVMPRKGYTLEKLLAKRHSSLKARIIVWSNGLEILEQLRASMKYD